MHYNMISAKGNQLLSTALLKTCEPLSYICFPIADYE
jgi:hypothetical protein